MNGRERCLHVETHLVLFTQEYVASLVLCLAIKPQRMVFFANWGCNLIIPVAVMISLHMQWTISCYSCCPPVTPHTSLALCISRLLLGCIVHMCLFQKRVRAWSQRWGCLGFVSGPGEVMCADAAKLNWCAWDRPDHVHECQLAHMLWTSFILQLCSLFSLAGLH